MLARISRRICASLLVVAGGAGLAACSGFHAAPTATPPPTSTAAPTIAWTPPPASTPAASAASVPTSIDATCASDAGPALNAWIGTQPDGSTLVFPSGSCYRLEGDAGLQLDGRANLTLVGTGSTLQLRTNGASNRSAAFFLEDSTDISIRGFSVEGDNAATGTVDAAAQVNERINAAVIRSGSKRIEFDGVRWDNLRGFGPIMGTEGGTAWPEDISIHDCFIRGGEMGIAIVAGRNVRLERNTINDSVWYAFDMEPDASTAGPNGEEGYGGGFVNVLISDNDVTRYGWGDTMTSWFAAFVPQDPVVETVVMDGLTITGNRVHEGAARSTGRADEGAGGLAIRGDKGNPKRGITITDNWTADEDLRSAAYAVITVANVSDLVVTGNRQPIARGSAFILDTGTTGTRIVDANDVAP